MLSPAEDQKSPEHPANHPRSSNGARLGRPRSVATLRHHDADEIRESINLSIPISEIERSNPDARCCRLPPKLIGFFVKVSICVFVLAFSMFKLATADPCPCADDSAVYISLISSILSYFVGQHTK